LGLLQVCSNGRVLACKGQHFTIYQFRRTSIGSPTGTLQIARYNYPHTPPPSTPLFTSKPSDWYSITLADLKNIGASSTLRRADLEKALQEKYPDFKWEKKLLLRGRYAEQIRLERIVAELFPVRLFITSFTLHFVLIVEFTHRERRW